VVAVGVATYRPRVEVVMIVVRDPHIGGIEDCRRRMATTYTRELDIHSFASEATATVVVDGETVTMVIRLKDAIMEHRDSVILIVGIICLAVVAIGGR
jgi:hypothetical protein